MNVTISHPGKMTVQPKHVIKDRVMVNLDEGDHNAAVTLWVKPEVAAQWIEALTPSRRAGEGMTDRQFRIRTAVRFAALTTAMLAGYVLLHLMAAAPFLVAGL